MNGKTPGKNIPAECGYTGRNYRGRETDVVEKRAIVYGIPIALAIGRQGYVGSRSGIAEQISDVPVNIEHISVRCRVQPTLFRCVDNMQGVISDAAVLPALCGYG